MPSYYEAVGEEPTYGLAENIIRATTLNLKKIVSFMKLILRIRAIEKIQ